LLRFDLRCRPHLSDIRPQTSDLGRRPSACIKTAQPARIVNIVFSPRECCRWRCCLRSQSLPFRCCCRHRWPLASHSAAADAGAPAVAANANYCSRWRCRCCLRSAVALTALHSRRRVGVWGRATTLQSFWPFPPMPRAGPSSPESQPHHHWTLSVLSRDSISFRPHAVRHGSICITLFPVSSSLINATDSVVSG
jgi:hypothetical protein